MSMLNAFTAGAMRLPNKVNEKHKIHYITDHYVRTFKLKILPFKNADKNTLLKFYDMKPMTLTGESSSGHKEIQSNQFLFNMPCRMEWQ